MWGANIAGFLKVAKAMLAQASSRKKHRKTKSADADQT
jgi:hypothetical protein